MLDDGAGDGHDAGRVVGESGSTAGDITVMGKVNYIDGSCVRQGFRLPP